MATAVLTIDWTTLESVTRQVGLTRLDLGEPDHALLVDLLMCMETTGADMTNTFRLLSRVSPATDGEQGADPVLEALLDQVGLCCEIVGLRAKLTIHFSCIHRFYDPP